MSAKLQPVASPGDQPLLVDVISNVCRDVSGRSAIVQKLAEASVAYEPGGINHELDRHFWHGVQQLMRDNIRDLRTLKTRADEADQ